MSPSGTTEDFATPPVTNFCRDFSRVAADVRRFSLAARSAVRFPGPSRSLPSASLSLSASSYASHPSHASCMSCISRMFLFPRAASVYRLIQEFLDSLLNVWHGYPMTFHVERLCRSFALVRQVSHPPQFPNSVRLAKTTLFFTAMQSSLHSSPPDQSESNPVKLDQTQSNQKLLLSVRSIRILSYFLR
jgi:hypothetical protein